MSYKKNRLLSRAHGVWTELGYAQRRLFEIRTGVPVTTRASGRHGVSRRG
jgi:hypothetical protein